MNFAGSNQFLAFLGECQVLHLGAQLQQADLGNFVPSTTLCATSHGFLVDSKLKFKSLYTDLNVRASQISVIILRSLPRVIPSY